MITKYEIYTLIHHKYGEDKTWLLKYEIHTETWNSHRYYSKHWPKKKAAINSPAYVISSTWIQMYYKCTIQSACGHTLSSMH